MTNTLAEIQSWYLAHCNGDWEHEFGVEIGTLDNPGWGIRIDLSGTELENEAFEDLKLERTEDDWVVCSREANRFLGFGGPENLEEMLQIFLDWSRGRPIGNLDSNGNSRCTK